MLHKKHRKVIFFALIMACLLTGPLTGLASIPLFPMLGIWYQSEPLALALFVLGGLSSITLFFGMLIYPYLIRWAIYHPVVYLPAMIALLSFIQSIFSINFLSNLLGNVQTGQGIAWFLSIAVLSAVARIIFKVFPLRQKILILSYIIISVVTISFFSIVGIHEWKMFFFDDHLAFYAVLLWGLPFVVFQNKTKAYSIAFGTSSLIILFSANLSAGVALFVMMMATPLYYYIQKKFVHIGPLRNVASILLVSMAVLIFLTELFLNETFLFKSLSSQLESTMHSRHLLLNVIIDELQSSPFSYLFGNGWGQFSAFLMKNIPFDKTAVYYSGENFFNENLWMWDSIQRFDFHSHNIFIETLGSAGTIGLCLLLFYVFSLARYSKKNCFGAAFGCVAGFILLNSMWFQMPSTVGVMAFVFGGLSGEGPFKKALWSIKPRITFIVLLFPLSVLGYAIISAYDMARQGGQQVALNISSHKTDKLTCSSFIADSHKNGYHFSELFRTYVKRLSAELKEDPSKVSDLGSWNRLDNYLCQSDIRLHENNELISGVRGLMARADFIFKFRKETKAHPVLYNRIISGWASNIDKVLKLAPNRHDLVVPYFNWLLETGQEDELYERSQPIILHSEAKPIGLWFSGIVLLNKRDQFEKGVKLMREAISNDLEKFMPIDPKLKKQLTEP